LDLLFDFSIEGNKMKRRYTESERRQRLKNSLSKEKFEKLELDREIKRMESAREIQESIDQDNWFDELNRKVIK
jgi:hypothetical protein